jgi:hypothetical protein
MAPVEPHAQDLVIKSPADPVFTPKMTTLTRLPVLGAAALLLALAAACDIDHGKAESLIVTTFADRQITAKATCPSGVKLENGGTFECTVVVDEIEFPVTIKQIDDKGTVQFRDTDHIYFTDELAREIEGNVKQTRNVDIDVVCKEPYWVFSPKAEHSCEVVGEPARVAFVFADTAPGGKWEVVAK